jgi:hypothetical protein
MHIGHDIGKQTIVASLYLWVTVRLGLPAASYSRASAIETSKPSTLGDEVGLSKEPAGGLSKWEGPATQGPFTARLS